MPTDLETLAAEVRAIRDIMEGRLADPFVSGEEAARLLRLKHARNLPASLTRYYRDGKKGNPLFKRTEVLGMLRPKRRTISKS